MIELRMPSFGADMDAARFVQWQVKPGQVLQRGDVVAVVETQKGAIDVELWHDGTMARLIAQPGQRHVAAERMADQHDALCAAQCQGPSDGGDHEGLRIALRLSP